AMIIEALDDCSVKLLRSFDQETILVFFDLNLHCAKITDDGIDSSAFFDSQFFGLRDLQRSIDLRSKNCKDWYLVNQIGDHCAWNVEPALEARMFYGDICHRLTLE